MALSTYLKAVMKHYFLPSILVTFLLFLLPCSPCLSKEATIEDAKQIASRVARIPLNKNCEKIEVIDVKKDGLTFVLWFRELPNGYDEVEFSTSFLCEACKSHWNEANLDVPAIGFQVAVRAWKKEPNDKVRIMGTSYWDGETITFQKR